MLGNQPDRLQWAQQNRRKASRTRSTAELAARLADRLDAPDRGAKSRVARVIDELVDDEFRRECRLLAVQRGKVLINVLRYEMVYPLRIRWVYPLRQALGQAGLGAVASQFVFQQGADGDAIGQLG